MNLLLLDQFSQPGGAQQVLLDLLPGIRDRGWKAVVGLPGEGELFEQIRSLGFPVERIPCGPYAAGRKSAADAARFLTDTPALARQIARLAAGVDLVYVNGPRLLPAAALAGLDAPVLFHAHSYLFPGAVRKLAGIALRRLDARVVGNCRFVVDVWRGFVKEDRLSVIYNGVVGPDRPLPDAKESGDAPGDLRECGGPLRKVGASPHSFPANEGRSSIGCIGRIAPEKGQLEFLQAARAIHGAVPDCGFVVYGAPLFSGDECAERVYAAASGLPVEFPGWVTDIYSAMSNLDLLLVPSAAHEATTRVIMEAFSAGVPVIAFRSGGIPEVVEDGRTGVLVSDAEEMARAAIELLRDGARYASIRAAARESWERNFTIARFREQVLRAIETAARA
jgi:glycosyltransferase involved in cell wall biosynthesis